MTINTDQLVNVGVRRSNTERLIDALNQQMTHHQISTRLRVYHFLAQVLHESGKFRLMEKISIILHKVYSAHSHDILPQDGAQQYARKPRKINNRVYANRMGEASGNDYHYRGCGLIQLIRTVASVRGTLELNAMEHI